MNKERLDDLIWDLTDYKNDLKALEAEIERTITEIIETLKDISKGEKNE